MPAAINISLTALGILASNVFEGAMGSRTGSRVWSLTASTTWLRRMNGRVAVQSPIRVVDVDLSRSTGA
jgi:hypothetical protein